MSVIPDCRAKYEKDVSMPYADRKKVDKNKINPYWSGLLIGEDRTFLEGYDFLKDEVVDSMFCNIEVFDDILRDVGLDVSELDESVLMGDKSYNEFEPEELGDMSKTTRFLLAMKCVVDFYTEMSRDELVTSMIDGMDEDTYTASYERASEEG